MTTSYHHHQPATDLPQELLAKLPPWFAADLVLRLDKASVYQRVIDGWAHRLETLPNSANAMKLLVWLLKNGEPCSGGYLHLAKPSHRSLRDAIGMGTHGPRDAWNDLRGTGLVVDHPARPGWIRVFGHLSDIPKADEQGDLFGTREPQTLGIDRRYSADSSGQASTDRRCSDDPPYHTSALQRRCAPPHIGAGAPVTGARAPIDRRCSADAPPPPRPYTYSQKTSCLSDLSDVVDVNARDGREDHSVMEVDESQIDELRELIRVETGLGNPKSIDTAARTPGLNPAAVRWCAQQARKRAENARQRPGLAYRLILDRDWEGVSDQPSTGERQAQEKQQQREREQAEQREAAEHFRIIDETLARISDDDMTSLVSQAIDEAPAGLKRLWARQPIPPTDRVLRSEVFKLWHAERTRREGLHVPVTDAPTGGSPSGSPPVDFGGNVAGSHSTHNTARIP